MPSVFKAIKTEYHYNGGQFGAISLPANPRITLYTKYLCIHHLWLNKGRRNCCPDMEKQQQLLLTAVCRKSEVGEESIHRSFLFFIFTCWESCKLQTRISCPHNPSLTSFLKESCSRIGIARQDFLCCINGSSEICFTLAEDSEKNIISR